MTGCLRSTETEGLKLETKELSHTGDEPRGKRHYGRFLKRSDLRSDWCPE